MGRVSNYGTKIERPLNSFNFLISSDESGRANLIFQLLVINRK